MAGPSMLTAGELAEYMPSLRGLINGRHEFEEDPYRPPPTVRRQLVDALIARMEPAGTEELRGALTWRYRLTLGPSVKPDLTQAAPSAHQS